MYVTDSRLINESFDIFVNEVIFENLAPNGVIDIQSNDDKSLLLAFCTFFNSYKPDSGTISKTGSGSCTQYRVCNSNHILFEKNIKCSHSILNLRIYDDKIDILESSFEYIKPTHAVLYNNAKFEKLVSINISHANDTCLTRGNDMADFIVNFSNFYDVTSNQAIFEVPVVAISNIIKCINGDYGFFVDWGIVLIRCFIKECSTKKFFQFLIVSDNPINLLGCHFVDNSFEPDWDKNANINTTEPFNTIENRHLSTVVCEAERKFLPEDDLKLSSICNINSKFKNIFPLFHVLTSSKRKTKTILNPKKRIHSESSLKSKMKKVLKSMRK